MDGIMTPETVAPIAVHDGALDIPLDGGTVTLTANLFAAKGICRHFGGFQESLNRIAAGDIEAMIAVVRYGLGVKSEAEARKLEEPVFRTGILKLTSPLTEFLLVCANGGKAIGAEADTPETPGKGDT